jgi:hypothetical protein
MWSKNWTFEQCLVEIEAPDYQAAKVFSKFYHVMKSFFESKANEWTATGNGVVTWLCTHVLHFSTHRSCNKYVTHDFLLNEKRPRLTAYRKYETETECKQRESVNKRE